MQTSIYASLLALLLTLLHGTCARAQGTPPRQSFESTTDASLPYASTTAPYGGGGLPTWNVVERCGGIDTAAHGTHFWVARDVENAMSGTSRSTLDFSADTICHLTSARFVFAYNVQGYDGGDDFGYVLYLDGFPTEEVILIDGKNGGGVSTSGWVYDTVAIPGTAETARLSLFFEQNGDDVAGVDDVQLLATGDDGNCRPVCGIRLGKPVLHCSEFTDGPDLLRLSLPYTGAEAGARVYCSEGVVGGDDPGAVAGGTITATGLTEGGFYTLQVRGGACDLTVPLEIPTAQCAPGSVVINEVLADPGEDINGDGRVDAGDEFVELYNVGATAYDLSRHTLHDGSNSGARFTFPEGTLLAPGATYSILATEGEGLGGGCTYGVARGFLGLNNDSPETVTLRTASGRVVAQADFADAPAGASLVLSPDGNLAGGYQPHTEVDGNRSTACQTAAALPVELRFFTATSLHDAVRLDWATDAERHNDRFVIERSKAGRTFTPFGEVPAGNGRYSYVDYTPFPGQNLYRLRQVDVDGRETVYGPVLVRTDSGDVRVYPNPVVGKLHLSGEVAATEQVTVFRADGRLVRRFTGAEANLRDLPAGVYYLRLSRASGAPSFRFIKE
ncbi:lamin tail domain-containing protein [Lewinella sp. IMCC34183]|uniref:lamin tail domain-containing protein n=1 Tax=Lewinella sp. IMCC34183 TaxID=2248762 RepID=UPI0018E563B6|nr:lamin tail domain-containing protein [Lewinella sp. IMCC34183]